MGYTALEDLKTLLTNNFIHTNITSVTLTADPAIVYRKNLSITTYPGNGLIILEKENLVRIETAGNYRIEVYAIDMTLMYDSSTSAGIKEILDEIDRVFNANNDDSSRSFDYKLLFVWDSGTADALIEIKAEATKKWTANNT